MQRDDPALNVTRFGDGANARVIGAVDAGRVLMLEQYDADGGAPSCATAVYDLRTLARTELARGSDRCDDTPWGLSGDLAVVERDARGVSDLWLYDLRGGPPRQVTNHSRRSTPARLDGRWLVWSDDRNDHWDLYATTMGELRGRSADRASAGSAVTGLWSRPAHGGTLRRMGDAAAQSRIEYQTYLAIEQETDRKHEWLDGRIYAMAGGSIAHGQLAAQVIMELGRLASPCGCRVHTADVKIRVRATGLATYPDASVICGPTERDPDDGNAVANPAVLVEVLSDGTEAYDRGDKFAHYRQSPALRDVILVSQHEARVEVYSRDHHGRWVLSTANAGERFSLSAMEGAIEVDRVYADVELVPAPPRAARN